MTVDIDTMIGKFATLFIADRHPDKGFIAQTTNDVVGRFSSCDEDMELLRYYTCYAMKAAITAHKGKLRRKIITSDEYKDQLQKESDALREQRDKYITATQVARLKKEAISAERDLARAEKLAKQMKKSVTPPVKYHVVTLAELLK